MNHTKSHLTSYIKLIFESVPECRWFSCHKNRIEWNPTVCHGICIIIGVSHQKNCVFQNSNNDAGDFKSYVSKV